MSSCGSQFAKFIENISLGDRQIERIESAAGALDTYLRQEYELESPEDVFVQGSYANHTAIRPSSDGEYDVDIVAVCAGQDESANDAVDTLFDTLAANGRYKDKLVRKNPCVRIEYADDEIGQFHVDVVPVRAGLAGDAPLEAPRRDKGWHGTAPREFTQWCLDQGGLFERTVKALKHWRNEQQDRAAIKSIVLQVLVQDHMPIDVDDDAERLTLTLESLSMTMANLHDVPFIANPVLPSEDLAARWSSANMQDFISHLNDAAKLAREALDEVDDVASAQQWRELFGGDAFPLPTALVHVEVADTTHAQHPAQEGWVEAYDPSYHLELHATEQRGKRGKAQRYGSGGPLLFPGKKIRFNARGTRPAGSEIWWRVTNTGAHARSVEGLRGDFFKAKGVNNRPSSDEAVNWEDTSYTGAHLVEAFLVIGNRVVAKTEAFRVNIYNKRHRWAP